MKEKIRENNQEQNTSKDQTGWQRHFTPKNLIINGLIVLIPASLIIGILRESGIGGGLVVTGILFGLMYLAGEIREKIKRVIKKHKTK